MAGGAGGGGGGGGGVGGAGGALTVMVKLRESVWSGLEVSRTQTVTL